MEIIRENAKKLLDWSMPAAAKLLACAVLLLIGLALVRRFAGRIREGKVFRRLEPNLRSFTAGAARITLDVLLFLTAAAILGIPMASFITVLASCGVAIGLALQGALGNLAGGIMLLLFHPFRTGDYIEAGGKEGFVADISVFYTTLRTWDHRTVTMPNGTLTNSLITNYSREGNRRVDLEFSAAYGSSIDEVKSVLLKTISAHEKVLAEPAAAVMLSENGENGQKYTLRAWCRNEDYWSVYFEGMESCTKALAEAGIVIPFPQVDVHVKNNS